MIDSERFNDDIVAARGKLRSRLGVRGRSLAAQLRRAGRALPKPARAAGQRLVELQPMVAHPRLRRLVQHDEVSAALAELNTHLDGVNASERRTDRLLGLAGSIVGNLLLLAVLLVVFMRWRGLV